MRVKIYDTDATGAEIFRAECDLAECGLDDNGYNDDEYAIALYELQNTGRYWIGGGASPLVLLMRVPCCG
jgi:hypothetical protein